MDVSDTRRATVAVESDQGSGRSFVIVTDDVSYAGLVKAIAAVISQRARAIVIRSEPILAENWRALAEDFERTLVSLGIRQASFIGIAAGATLAQNLALEVPKVVRTLAIVDASLRPHPSRVERALDTLEEKLPFGLPLRLGSAGFNVRAFAHRLRCPMLLVGTHKASRFVREELKALGSVAPTAWFVDLTAVSDQEQAAELCDVILAFQDTPAKCPQKNLQEAV